jgi:hypothetical protein
LLLGRLVPDIMVYIIGVFNSKEKGKF